MSDGITLVRLTTVHPALVHFALGTLPLLVLAYGVALWRRSEQWAFVGDVTLIVTAALTLVVAAFGLVSNWVLDWPGGIGFWRWLHLGFGAGSALLLIALAGVRLTRRRRSPLPSVTTVWAVAGTGLAMLFAGWIGGEVLVFRSGMAVEAAAKGALAPTSVATGKPHDVMSAMLRLRPAWARATGSLAEAVVHEPSSESYTDIARAAKSIRDSAEWIEANPPANHERARFQRMAGQLSKQATALEDAATAQRLPDVARALGEVTATCSGCHDHLRWHEQGETEENDEKATARRP